MTGAGEGRGGGQGRSCVTRPVPALHWRQVQMARRFGGARSVPMVPSPLSTLQIVIIKATLFQLTFVERAYYVSVTVLLFKFPHFPIQ